MSNRSMSLRKGAADTRVRSLMADGQPRNAVQIARDTGLSFESAFHAAGKLATARFLAVDHDGAVFRLAGSVPEAA